MGGYFVFYPYPEGLGSTYIFATNTLPHHRHGQSGLEFENYQNDDETQCRAAPRVIKYSPPVAIEVLPAIRLEGD